MAIIELIRLGPEDSSFVPPSSFDGFVVERPLGRGGMGHVYLGRDVELDRSVALKFIATHEGSTTALERFRREARAIARLSHQNVVNIYRIGEVGGQPYIAYELVSGKSLDRTSMPLPWQIVLRIAVGIARGLDAVHRAGILHRDLKPANVVLSEAGEIKLIDFGLASLVAGEPILSEGAAGAGATADSHAAASQMETALPTARTIDNLHLTRPGSVLGTPTYIAPEVWWGEGASTKSDVFALGMTLYEMLVGSLPHASLPFEELAAFIMNAELPSLRARRPDLPESFAAIVERCLRKDPIERFASGAELREVLETTERIFLPAGGSALDALVLEPNHVAVASSFTRVKNASNEFARTIYDRLFARAPELRELFPSDMNGQEKKLLHMIEVAIDALSNTQTIDAMLADLGRRHVHYGARVEHFAPLWAALLDALEQHEGPAWTAELASAWRHALALLEERMRRGMTLEKPTFVSSAKAAKAVQAAKNVLRASPPMFGLRPSSKTPSEWKPPRTQYAHRGAVDIAYQTFGSGPVDIVVLMGWLSHLELNWGHTSLMSFLEQLGRFARVVTYDRRGTGLSVRAQETATLDDHVDDLLLVCEEARLERPVLFGIADGGGTAVLGAALHPNRFSGLVLYGTTPKMIATPDFPSGSSEESLAFIEREILTKWGEPILLEAQAPSMVDDDEFCDWFALYMRMSASPQNAWSMMRSNAARDLRPVLPHATLPALVLHRAGDRMISVASGRYLAEHLPHATFAELVGDDHLPWVGATDELLRLIRDFVSRVKPAAATLSATAVRLVAVFRARSLEGTAETLAATLGGDALGEVNGARAYAFSKGREAVVFLQRLAETAHANGSDDELACALDAMPLAVGGEAALDAVRRAAMLLDHAALGRAPLSALAAALVTSSTPLEPLMGAHASIALLPKASAA